MAGGLTGAQRAALAAVRRRGTPATPDLTDVADAVARRGRVTLNFHPYRRLTDGRTVVEGLLEDGIYHGQFVTGISNGSATAYPGGDRDRWERLLFEDAYRDVAAPERPKYGALALMGHGDGASPRFGCAYIRLRPDVSQRSTFTWQDSHLGPEHVGTLDALGAILRATFAALERDGETLGVRGLGAAGLRARLLESPPGDPARRPVGRALDDYVEAQVHGEIRLDRDVEHLVVDPGLRETEIGDSLRRLEERYGVPLSWHTGFRLAPADIPEAFRGPDVPRLARRLTDGTVDTGVLAEGARSMWAEPRRWNDLGTEAEYLQLLKQLWHCLVAFG